MKTLEKSRQNSAVTLLFPWFVPLALVLTWISASRFSLIPHYLLPPPQQVAAAGYDYLFGTPQSAPYAGRFVSDLYASLSRVLSGFFFAVAAGIPLGVLSGRLETVDRLLGASINGMRAVPGICWLPLSMIWFGIGMKTTVFLVGLAAFFPIYLNAASGARQVNPILLQAGAMMGVKRLRGTFAILLPSAMPQIVTGLRLGLGISWAYLVLGELTGVPNGLGAVIMDARMIGRTNVIIVGIALIAVVGKLSDQLLHALLKMFFKSARRAA